MSVTLIEAGLAALFDSPTSPVGRYVTRVADEMVGQARANVRDYFHSAPTLNVDEDVVAQPAEGNGVEVGIRDAGDKSRRLAEAQIQGRVNWLGRARETTRQRFTNG